MRTRTGHNASKTIRTKSVQVEEIYYPGDSLPLYLDKKSETLKIIQQIRDESHRFGLSHHRDKRSKLSLTSSLDDIKGIGDKSKKELLRTFKSVKRIKEASLGELKEVIGISRAIKITEFYKNKP